MKNRLVEAGEIRAMAAPSPDERKATEIIFDDRPAPAEFSRRRPIDAAERCSIGTSARRHARLETDRTGRFFFMPGRDDGARVEPISERAERRRSMPRKLADRNHRRRCAHVEPTGGVSVAEMIAAGSGQAVTRSRRSPKTMPAALGGRHGRHHSIDQWSSFSISVS